MRSTITVPPNYLERPISEKSSRKQVTALVAVAVVVWGLTVYLSTLMDVASPVRFVALAAHILSMVAAFGAVLLVDWHGFLWLLGRRALSETVRLDGAATPLIWGGLAGMMITGIFLEPNLASPLTMAKLFAVLVLTLNGLMLIPLMRRLVRLSPITPFSGLPMGQRIHLMLGAAISQAAWWTAIIVGFINAGT